MNSAPATAVDLRRAPALYIITDRHATAGRPLLQVLTHALEGAADAGVTPGTVAVQLREKDLDARPLLELARALRVLTTRFGAHLYINDRVDVALAAGADGVHLTGTSITPAEVSAIAPELAVAVSAHGRADLDRASHESDGNGNGNVRFAVLGPIFDTPSKRRFGPPLGLVALAATAERMLPIAFPVLALGGVTVENARACVAAGAAGVSMIRAVLAAPDARKTAFSLCWAILERGSPHDVRDLT